MTILGSVSVSTIPTVGMLEMLHSLINARFSEGLRTTTMSGRCEPALIGLGPKLRARMTIRSRDVSKVVDKHEMGYRTY